MNSRRLSFLLALVLLLLFQSCSDQKVEENPNVILFIADDQGWADMGYHNQAVYTPNLDRLASEGVTLSQHYSMPQCTPTRIALFTGRYPGRFGTSGLQASNEQVLPHGTFTLATMFREAGYNTFLCGKWHMGSSPEYGPNDYGFDESYGSLAGAIGMYDHRYRDGSYEMTWHRNHEIIPGYENGIHATDLVAGEAIKYIRRKHDKPFFMYLAFHAPHTPLDERGDFVDQPTQIDPDDSLCWNNEDKIQWFNDPEGKIQSETDPEKRLFLAVVHHLDHAIGSIVQVLEEEGLRENTLILYTSDNGPQVNWPGNAYPDDLKLTDFNQQIPMKGSKTDVWEGGIHVPGFANWPGQLMPKSISEATHVVDFLPTLASIIGYENIKTESVDGTDLSPILFSDNSLKRRDLYWIWNSEIDRWALRYGDWKIVKYGVKEPDESSDWQLFNIAEDKKEQTNLSDRYPDTARILHNMFLVQRSKDSVMLD